MVPLHNSLCISRHSGQVEPTMVPETASDAGNATPAQSETPPRSRRGRRGGRGRRGRGRRADQTPTEQPPPPPEEAASPDQAVAEPTPAAPETAPPSRRDFQPASPAAVEKAIEQVNHIVETLRAALDDMEEVLETVELAERQKNADEQEIEALRRSLRQLHRPREGGLAQSRR
jgi:ribonuclease E